MKNKYNCISVSGITRAIILVLLVILPNLLLAQQSPSIQTDVTFQWLENTQPTTTSPATIQSITIGGQVYNTFVVPSGYEMTRLGPNGHASNRILENGATLANGSNVTNWDNIALSAFQDKNLNHYFTSNDNGRNICLDFDAVETTDAQKQSIFYSPAIPSNEGGVLAVTERHINNCYHVAMYGTPVGGGPEQLLGQTFVRPNSGALTGPILANQEPNPGTDYWKTGRVVESNGTIGIALFYLSDIVPTGSKISRIEFNASTTDHGDGKFFLLQKYAVDQQNINCIDTKYSGDLNVSNNVPDNSTYSLVSGPTPAGQSFTLNTDGTYSYIPTAGFTGDITFEYQVCLPAPNTSVCDNATVTINFVDVPPIPEASISCGSTNDDFSISMTSPLGAEFEYAINNGTYQSSPNFNNLPEGSYIITIRNSYTSCENINPMTFVLDNLELNGVVTNVLCKPDNSGEIDITPSGGNTPYTYQWSNGATSEDLIDIAAGTYSVIVTDANGCTITQDFTINEPAEELASTINSTTNVLCFGENTGEIDLSITGGTAPYSVIWNNGSTDQDLNGIVAGVYDVTITDANGCNTTNQTTITQPTSALVATITDSSNIDCNGNSTGSIAVEASGGTSPYNYSIDAGVNNQATGLFENLTPGNYTILVTDSNNCTTTVATTISEPDVLEVSIISVNNVDCSGEATGDITTDVTGGTLPYSYSWTNGSTNQNLTDVIAGSYTVTITDANGCTTSANTTISEPANPLNINISKVDATTSQGCTNGEATADVSGGTAPYTYQWSSSANSQTTVTAANLPAGSHSVTITDANGCELTQSIVIVCVNTCDAELTIGTILNVLCVGDATGSGTVSASSNANPNATYTFTWSNGQIDAGVTSSTINNVTAGVYDVSVTIDGTVCQPVEETISITEPNNALNLNASSTDELGPNTNDGTASATVTGGVEPYTFLWSPNGETTQNISGLASGTYTVTVTDANGCTDIATVTVNPGSCNNLSISGSSTPVICNGESNGSVTAIVSNGTGPFTFAWDTLPDTTPIVTNLPAGDYTITVTDQTTLCTQSTTITINEPNALSTGIAVTNILCKDDSTGSVDLTVNGGTSPYTFLWNTGVTTEDLVDVIAGTYSVTVTDANGCTTTNQSDVNEPAESVSGSITQITNVECLGENTGSLTVAGSGGIPPYTYSINNQTSFQTNQLFDNLAASTYTILITDANGCTFSIDGTIGTDDIESPEITVPPTIVIEGCDTSYITSDNSVFTFSNIQSSDVQAIFASNLDYNASDDFNIQSITYIDVVTSTDTCPILVSRTFTITDNCNNSVTASQTITVQDTTAPTFTVPADITIECDQDASDLVITGNVTDEADNCSSGIEATYSDSIAKGSCSNESTITRTWSLIDECDNTTMLIQTINLVDTTAPTFTTPADLTIECAIDANDLSITGDVTDESDNCDSGLEAIYKDIISDGTCPGSYTIFRKWTLVDSCDNVETGLQTITVQDITAPTFTVPADITIECDVDITDLSLTGDVTDETDNCSTGLEATYSDKSVAGSCGNESIITRTWILTDECDNTTILLQTINVVDTTAPTFTTPADLTVECSINVDDLTITGDVTDENDNCDTGLEAIYKDIISDGPCPGSYTIFRKWTLVDTCDNVETGLQTITVQDTTAPTFTVPADITIECDVDATDISITGDVTDETDNCSTGLEANYADKITTGSCANELIITRTWTLTDECDNVTILLQTINVVDSTAPTFSAPANLTVECDTDTTDLTITGDVTDESDNCDTGLEAVYTDTVADGSCANESIITRTWSLSDACDNTTTLVQTINVVDTTAPTFTVPVDLTIECDVDAMDLTFTGDVTDETDNCSTGLEATYTDSRADGNCANEAVITRTWAVTDDCDNTTTLVQTITIQDTTAPTFTVPSDITIECDIDELDLNNTGDVTDETDNCSSGLEATFTDVTIDGSCRDSYTIERTWTLEDDCDNTTVLVQTITVQDTTAPTFTVPADITVDCDFVINDLTITGDVTDEADNCDSGMEATFTDVVLTGNCINESIITRTWAVTDDCGNTTELVQTITVLDTIAPTFNNTLPTDVTLECDAIPAVETITATDNCGEATVTVEETTTTGNCANEYVLVRVYTASDVCGNETEHIQNITVQDTTAPTFNEALPADSVVECDAIPTAQTLTATDNCSTPNVIFTEDITNGGCAGNYIIERTWSVTDPCGNNNLHTQIIEVQDTTAPTLVTPYEAVINIACDEIPEVPSLVFEDACSTDIEVTFEETSTQVNDFEDYEIIRTWMVTDDCGNQAPYTQTIIVEFTNVITATDTSRCVLDSEFDLFDLLSGDFNMDGSWTVVSGNVILDGSLFDPTSVEVGDYVLNYSITEGSCPAEAQVTVAIDDDCVVLPCGSEDVVISKTVTANGDNYNEFFAITGVETCGFVIELQIFNRWGAEIYKSSNYQNDWNGDAHGSSAGSSGKVPTGTYYYVINLRNSGLEPFAGPIYVATK